IRLRPAATPEEKSIAALGSTIVYRLLPGNEDGWYTARTLEEGFEELLESMPAGAGSSPGVDKELERLERDLAKVSGEAAKLFGRKVPLSLDKNSIGNNLSVAREMDPAVISEGLREVAGNEEMLPLLKQFSKEIGTITVRATLDPTERTCELDNKEWVIYLPAIAGNVAGFLGDQLREILNQQHDE